MSTDEGRAAKPVKAVGLMSGGLDSTLAARVLRDQGVEVIGLNFNTGFCTYDHHRAIGRKDEDPRRLRNVAIQAGAEAQVEVRIVDVADEYLEMVKHPKHGYGNAANPCIDCRIFMLNKAREVAEAEGAEIIFTGEVLGQRPMSQHRNALQMIEKETGLRGRLLRPLSAQHLDPTVAEREGRIDRGRLLAIKGRSRKDQQALADQMDIEDYPQPSGGCCFLADRNFGERFHDLVREEESGDRRVGRDEIMLLKVGRHFRLSPRLKVVVGRDEAENNFLERFRAGRWRLSAADFLGPVALMMGEAQEAHEADEAQMAIASSVTARYSDGKREPTLRVLAQWHDRTEDGPFGAAAPSEIRTFDVAPATEGLLVRLRVGA